MLLLLLVRREVRLVLESRRAHVRLLLGHLSLSLGSGKVEGQWVGIAGVQDRRGGRSGHDVVLAVLAGARAWGDGVLSAVGLKSAHRRRGLNAIIVALLLLLVVHLTGRVTAPVLAEVDLEALVFVLTTDSLDRLDGVRDVSEVYECTALLAQSVNQLDLTILLEVLPEALLGPGFVQVTNVDVARRTTGDSERNGRRKSTGVLAPADLQTAVVDHQALEVAQGVEGRSRGRVDESDKANVLVGNVTNVVKQTASDDVADLFDRGLRVDVAQVDGTVSNVVGTTSGLRDCSGGNGLLSKSTGNQITVRAVENMGITWSDAKVLCCVLLLGLGHVGATVLTVVHPTRRLPLRFLGKLSDGLDGVANGQEVYKANGLLANDLDGVNGTKLAQILTQLILRRLFWQVAEIDIA